jgi:hypothetical protein
MKFCAIGLGRMGRRHLQVAKNLGLEIVGVYDPMSESIKLAREEYNLSEQVVFSSAKEMLEKMKPDALVVSSTATSHCEYVCMAAEAGVKYILCEKPMAVSLAECDKMIAACELSGSLLAVNHQMQFMEQYTIVKKMVESPEFGGLRAVTVTAANFGLSMNGAHYFEMFRYMTDEVINKVSCWIDSEKVPNPRGQQYEDRSGQLRAVSTSGIRLYMELGGDLGHGIQVIYSCRLGQILVDELSGHLRYIHRQSEFSDLPTTRYGMPAVTEVRQIAPADVIKPTQDVWQAMFETLSFPDGLCGRHAVAVLVAANISGETDGKQINLAHELPADRVFPWA